jgi:hypothetical protein
MNDDSMFFMGFGNRDMSEIEVYGYYNGQGGMVCTSDGYVEYSLRSYYDNNKKKITVAYFNGSYGGDKDTALDYLKLSSGNIGLLYTVLMGKMDGTVANSKPFYLPKDGYRGIEEIGQKLVDKLKDKTK